MAETKISTARIILGATVFVILCHLFFLDISGITGTSMEPTLREGEVVLIFRLAYGLQLPLVNRYLVFWRSVEAGDLVVFNSPLDNRTVVKRCIAVEGTPIEIQGGILRLDGETFPLTKELSERLSGCTRVPEKTVLVVGDNRNRSIDSRSYGFIPLERIRGKVIGHNKGRTS